MVDRLIEKGFKEYPTPCPMAMIKNQDGSDSYFVVVDRDNNARVIIRWGVPHKERERGNWWEPMFYKEFATREEADLMIERLEEVFKKDEHITDGDNCWCDPIVEKYPNGNVIIHNRTDN